MIFKKRNNIKKENQSLENLLLSIEESKNNNFLLLKRKKLKNNNALINILSKLLLNKNLETEEKKDISLKSKKNLRIYKKFSFISKTLLNYIIPVHFILTFTFIIPFYNKTIEYMTYILDNVKTNEISSHLNGVLFNLEMVLAFLILGLGFYLVILACLTGNFFIKRFYLNKIKKEYNFDFQVQKIKDDLLKEIDLIDNPQLNNIKNELKDYIIKMNNNNYFFKSIQKKLELYVLDNTILNLDDKKILNNESPIGINL